MKITIECTPEEMKQLLDMIQPVRRDNSKITDEISHAVGNAVESALKINAKKPKVTVLFNGKEFNPVQSTD